MNIPQQTIVNGYLYHLDSWHYCNADRTQIRAIYFVCFEHEQTAYSKQVEKIINI